MGWGIVFVLAAITALGLLLFGRLPRKLWELTGAALLIGVAGYAWQGSPGLRGTPRDPAKLASRFDEDLAKMRRSFGGEYGEAGSWLTLSDGFARQGKTREAANVLLSGLRSRPDDAALWVGMGNALVAYGDGMLSPAAEYSYKKAMQLAPKSGAAPYFYGLALAQSGQYQDARTVWQALSDQLPEEAPLHAQLARNLALIDRILAGQSSSER